MKRDLSKYSDSELLLSLRSGKAESEAAFREIYSRHSSKVHAYCVGMIFDREQAEDIYQETFIRFYNSVRAEYDNSNIIGYLMKIARNLCLNYLRDKKEKVSIENFEIESDAGQKYEKDELFNLINVALELLDDKYREAFIMREYEGLTFEEIARITDTTLPNAKSRVQRARSKIISILQPYIDDLVK